ncbi:hypothetical protein ACIRD3_17615 [Kitasatospora sp. NPDC093550]|uniref:hypothetical protein n=1 Tax=Kitasatospora sp. NPDC093550 TaxID=3364089 RepID=UPI00381B82DC
MTGAERRPTDPADPSIRTFTEPQVAALLAEVRELGAKFGLLWPSATTDSVVDGRVLVRFGNAPTSTVLNLLALLRDAERAEVPSGS